jgi:hypothetical protein
MLFRTWNGKKTVYVLDEGQQIQGLETVGGPRAGGGAWTVQELGPPRPRDSQKLKRNRRR